MSAQSAPQAARNSKQPGTVKALEPDTRPAVAPTPAKAAPVPRTSVHTAPRSVSASKKADASKSGLPVGLIAGAAVAAVTVIVAGVSILRSGKKSSKSQVKKQSSRSSAPPRPTKSNSTKTPRTSTSSSGSTRPAGKRSSTTPRRTSSGGSRPSSRTSSRASSSTAASAAASPTSATPVRQTSIKAAAASASTNAPAAAASPRSPAAALPPRSPAAAAASPRSAATAASPKPPATAASPKAQSAVASPQAPAAAELAEKLEPGGTAGGHDSAPAAAAAPVAQSAPLEAAPASSPAAAAAVPEAADEPAVPATPPPAATAAAAAEPEATSTPPESQQQQQEPEQQQQQGSAEPAAQPEAAAAAAVKEEGVSEAAEVAKDQAAVEAGAATEEPAVTSASQEQAVEEPAAKQSAAAAAPEVDDAAATAEPVIEDAAAAEPVVENAATAEPVVEDEAAAANGIQPDEGDEGLIELAEGETLPVVDEAGNQLGTLHADGRVLDDSGTEIGALDEDGNVVLYEQQQGEEPVLSAVEEEAEQLMRQAAVAWNVQNNRDAAEKFQRKALEAVTQQAGGARPEIIAEVASSLADMLYARDKLIDAKDALQVALDAAEAAGQNALYIKLSNNMGAVLRKQDLHEEGKALHQKAMQVALDNFGVAHATTTLARGNLIDALDQLGDRDAARTLLTDSITQIKKVAEDKEADEAAKGGKPTEEETAAAVAAALKANQSPELAAMLAVDSSRAYTAAVRVQIELARLEMKDKQFPRAVEVLESALNMANTKFGDETAEASSVLAALATCHRQAGNLDTCVNLFEKLYGINERQSGGSAANQSGIMLAKTLSDVLQESDHNVDALHWSEKALSLMQQLAGVKVHPALEPYFNEVIELRNKTGDVAGADELRKQLLKVKAQMVGQASRTGPNSKAAAGKPPTGQAAGKAGATGKQKKGLKKK